MRTYSTLVQIPLALGRTARLVPLSGAAATMGPRSSSLTDRVDVGGQLSKMDVDDGFTESASLRACVAPDQTCAQSRRTVSSAHAVFTNLG
jgi:hypothetical protein